MSDFFAECRTANRGIVKAAAARVKAEAALRQAQDEETRAYAVLYAIPGVSADTATQITGEPLDKCQRELAAVKAVTGRGKA